MNKTIGQAHVKIRNYFQAYFYINAIISNLFGIFDVIFTDRDQVKV